MENVAIRRHFSRNTLFRMLVLGLAAAGLLFWNLELILKVYFRDQLTQTGYVINGAILALFVLGLSKIIAILLSYMREESALLRFMKNLETRRDNPLKGIGKNTIVSRRYLTMQKLHDARTPINQSALASTLVASESTRTSFPRFINNILILTGVFGTIVSLSIALLGASDLLESSVNVGGMGMVVHGMSTALSTTITAILCFVFFGYFYLKMNDVQTNLISALEQVTTTNLMPRFQVQTDSVLYEFTGLIRSLQGLADQMRDSQQVFEQVEQRTMESIEQFRSDQESIKQDMQTMVRILRIGFRLRDDE